MDRREMIKASAVCLTGLAWSVSAMAKLAPSGASVSTTTIPWTWGNETLRLALTRQIADGPAVLYVHGATFPAALSVGWRMDGVSWLDHLQRNGLDAWALDFSGYGASDRPSVFARKSSTAPAYGRFEVAAAQVVAALQHIRSQRPGVPIHVIAHSWGAHPARLAAIQHPELVGRLVLFGPVVTRKHHLPPPPPGMPAWWLMTSAEQRPRQRAGMPDHLPTPVSEGELDRWCAAYLDSDPTSGTRGPRSVKIPNGPIYDLSLEWSGSSLIDNRQIRQPTLIVRGEWDDVTTDADAAQLFSELSNVADKRDVKISGGNHWLHLQPRRQALWTEAVSFFKERNAT